MRVAVIICHLIVQVDGERLPGFGGEQVGANVRVPLRHLGPRVLSILADPPDGLSSQPDWLEKVVDCVASTTQRVRCRSG